MEYEKKLFRIIQTRTDIKLFFKNHQLLIKQHILSFIYKIKNIYKANIYISSHYL
jgi:hypothetical protein